MGRKMDPVQVIQDYFETASASEVGVMRSVITAIVRRRFDEAKPKPRKSKGTTTITRPKLETPPVLHGVGSD